MHLSVSLFFFFFVVVVVVVVFLLPLISLRPLASSLAFSLFVSPIHAESKLIFKIALCAKPLLVRRNVRHEGKTSLFSSRCFLIVLLNQFFSTKFRSSEISEFI